MEFREILASYESITYNNFKPSSQWGIGVNPPIAKMLHIIITVDDPTTTKFRIREQLHAIQLAINATYHMTLKASAAQLVFGPRQPFSIVNNNLLNNLR